MARAITTGNHKARTTWWRVSLPQLLDTPHYPALPGTPEAVARGAATDAPGGLMLLPTPPMNSPCSRVVAPLWLPTSWQGDRGMPTCGPLGPASYLLPLGVICHRWSSSQTPPIFTQDELHNLWGHVKNENEALVQKLLRTSRWRQQGSRPSLGPRARDPE